MRMLNLGIVAHVDAGKTSLTERLLFDAGALNRLGSVDEGSTQTDGMDLERRRGITIRSAVAAFTTGDHEIHLIDTPGHTDFVAEVERALQVLDGAILVLSAVEGVQAHTRVLMRILRSLAVPTILFVNKIDRNGARDTELMADIRRLLSPAAVAVTWPAHTGTKAATVTEVEPGPDLAEVLAEHSDAVLQSYLDGTGPDPAELARQTRQALVHPVFFGSAITGTGIAALRRGIVTLLPSTEPTMEGPLDGTVFAVEHDRTGRRAVARLFSGELKARDRIVSGTGEGRTTSVLDVHGKETRVVAGGIARIAGVPLRIGDRLGDTTSRPVRACIDVSRSMRVGSGAVPGVAAGSREYWLSLGVPAVAPGTASGPAIADGTSIHALARFRPPALETVVTSDSPDLFTALTRLADQDPLINVRRGQEPGSLVVSLYGEVQREVIAARLAEEFGVAARFSAPEVVCVERLTGTGAAVKYMRETLFVATVGLRVEPGRLDSGVRFRLEAERGSLPAAFITAIEDTVRLTLHTGLEGWQVVDCVVTLTHTGYDSPVSVAADFRGLTPVVLTDALRHAGTVVCEPWEHVEIDVPEQAVSPVLSLLVQCAGTPEMPVVKGEHATVEAVVPSARLREVEQALPGLTGGMGVLTARFAGYRER